MTTSMTASSLGFGLELPLSYERAIAQVTAALKEQGFGVLTTIDVKATLKEKLGEEFRPYAILGACNPPLAHRALSTDLEVGLMLPCNVVVYELDSKTSRVEFLDPLVALGVMGNQQLAPVAREARQRLEQVAKSLTE
ncbi:MAG TPA: DUF302 domain-containing protein [Chloroflexota bacterium]